MTSPLARLVAATAAACLLVPVGAAASAATTDGAPVGGPLLGAPGVVVDAGAGARPLPRLSARSFLLADLTTGDVLAAKNPHGRLRPASTLKMLTAVTLLPALDPETVYTAQWEDANAEGSRVGVVPDATYTIHNLFEGLFLMSGNDAAHALANAAGGVPSTVAKMNATAKSLGALDTTAVNPSGLDADGQVSSAYDLALIARAGLARQDFRDYVSTVRSTFPGKMPKPGKARRSFEIWTQDRLLLNYRGAIGVKTGWTTKARGTFVGAATRGGRTLVATVMHTGPRAWEEAAALLSWGFANAGRVTPVGTLVQPEPVAQHAAARDSAQPPARHAAAPADEVGGLPWYAWTFLVLVTAAAALRTRVLLRRRLRSGRRPQLPPWSSPPGPTPGDRPADSHIEA